MENQNQSMLSKEKVENGFDISKKLPGLISIGAKIDYNADMCSQFLIFQDISNNLKITPF